MGVNQTRPQPNNPVVFFAFITVLLLVAYATTSFAETYYVQPSAEIPLRRGQGTDYKILAVLANGTPVEILEDQAPWVRVVTKSGKEGWLFKRFLTRDKPLQNQVTDLKQANTKLQDDHISLQEQYSSIVILHEQAQKELTTTLTTLKNTGTAYAKLKEDAENVISLREKYSKSKSRMDTLEEEKDRLIAENDRLKASQNIKWFLAGSGTLILGCILGGILGRRKKKRSSLY